MAFHTLSLLRFPLRHFQRPKKRQTFLRPTCGLQTAQISFIWTTRSGLSYSIVSTTDKSIVWMNWNDGSSMSGVVLNVDFWRSIDLWWGRHRACVHAIGGNFLYSLWTDNVGVVHIFFIQCDLFDCYIFNYEIMPATLANTFLFIYKVVVVHLQIWGMVVDFRVHLVTVNFCL